MFDSLRDNYSFEKRRCIDKDVCIFWWEMLNGITGGKRKGLDALSQKMDDVADLLDGLNLAVVRCAQGLYYFSDGCRQRCCQVLKEAIDIFGNESLESYTEYFGFNLRILSKSIIARALADQCDESNAKHMSLSAIEEARSGQNDASLALALMHYALLHQQYHEASVVNAVSKELIAHAEHSHLRAYQVYGQILSDWSTGAVDRVEPTLQLLNTCGYRHSLGQFQSLYSELYAQQGDFAKAVELINECLRLDRSIGEKYYEAFLLFKKGTMILSNPSCSNEEGFSSLREACLKAKEQGVSYVQNLIGLSIC